MFKHWAIHPIFFAVFPILALLAHNITEVTPSIALRSITISLAATLILLILLFLVTRNWEKSSLIITLFLILFYTYGHVYEFLQKISIVGFSLGRHRYLMTIYVGIFAIGLWVILKYLKSPTNSTGYLNVVGLLLIIYPIFQIIIYSTQTTSREQRLAEVSPFTSSSSVHPNNDLPDVYFIVLDAYARGDALKQYFNFDNTSFVQELRQLGFFVADCSRSNDGGTHGSLAITLNMDYLPALRKEMSEQGFTNQNDVWLLIKQSKVRKLLSSLGYKTVAFESGFEWTRIKDADIYLEYTGAPYQMQVLQPFEAILIRNTALLIWSDTAYKSLPAYTNTIFRSTNFSIEDHINRQLFILDQLPRLASYTGPKFVFAHILIPHLPFVFSPTGDIQTDPGFYSKDNFFPIDGEYINKGYTDQIQFINYRLIPIMQTLITKSEVPPIIVLMGDHGLNFDNRLLNLSAYYLPGSTYNDLYPAITPVNSFRVIFDTYFGTHYGLLPDVSYDGSGQPVAETYPGCIQK
jgi:hypothetical protein